MAEIATSAPPSAARQVVRAASTVMLLFIVSRVLGLVRESVIAAQFGTLPEYSAYLAAFKVPDLLFNLVAGGALASAFIPALTHFITKGETAQGWRLTSAIANSLLLGLGGLALLVALIAPQLVQWVIAPGFSPELSALTASLMRYMLISTLIFSVSGLVMGVLNANQHFFWPASAPVLYNIGILVGGLVLAPRFGIYGLAFGVILGAAGHLLIQLPTLFRFGYRYSLTLGWRDPIIGPTVRQIGQLMGPRLLGVAVVHLMFVVNTIIASYYEPAVLPALNYAWIVMLLPHGIFASSIATTIFPTFSRMAAKNDAAGMRTALSQTLRAILLVVLPAAVGLFVLRVPIIQLLFERGEFTAQATQATAWALGFYAFGLIAHSLVEIASRAFYALQDTRTPVTIAVGAMLLNIVLSLVLIPFVGDATSVTRGPQGAIALANTIAASLEIIFMLWWLRPKMQGIAGGAVNQQWPSHGSRGGGDGSRALVYAY